MAYIVPETILFAVDLDSEVGQPVGDLKRLDVIKHAITNCTLAKRWACSQHSYGLLVVRQDTCSLHPPGVTSNAERFLETLQALQPPEPPGTHTSSSSSRPFDLGSLIAAAHALQQRAGGGSGPMQVQHLHDGTLTPLHNSSSSSSFGSNNSFNSSSGQQVRVVLVYCRSRLPAPVWHSHQEAGLAVDCLHVHDKPQPGEQQQQLQEVYSTLEQLVDRMAVRAGHASLIYESTAKNLGKLLSCMALMISHPAQRQPQAHAAPPVDLASADLQPLPSDTANAASAVPIVSRARAAAGAWARPLSAQPQAATGAVAAAAEAAGAASAPVLELRDTIQSPSCTPAASGVQQNAAAAAAAAAGGGAALAALSSQQQRMQDSRAGGSAAPRGSSVVDGVPVGCVKGTPGRDAAIGMNLGAGVVVGFEASTVAGCVDAAPAQQGAGPSSSSSGSRTPVVARAASTEIGSHAIAVESEVPAEALEVSAEDKQPELSAFYPKVL